MFIFASVLLSYRHVYLCSNNATSSMILNSFAQQIVTVIAASLLLSYHKLATVTAASLLLSLPHLFRSTAFGVTVTATSLCTATAICHCHRHISCKLPCSLAMLLYQNWAIRGISFAQRASVARYLSFRPSGDAGARRTKQRPQTAPSGAFCSATTNL